MSPKDSISEGPQYHSSYSGIPRTPTGFGEDFKSANDWLSGRFKRLEAHILTYRSSKGKNMG